VTNAFLSHLFLFCYDTNPRARVRVLYEFSVLRRTTTSYVFTLLNLHYHVEVSIDNLVITVVFFLYFVSSPFTLAEPPPPPSLGVTVLIMQQQRRLVSISSPFYFSGAHKGADVLMWIHRADSCSSFSS